MINHQLEALQSEAWGPMTEEQTLDFARRVRELLEAQEFETGYGRFEDLPDIVRHICGHAEAIERRQYGPPPWQTELADFIKQAAEMFPEWSVWVAGRTGGDPGEPEEGEPTRTDIIQAEFERRGIPVIDIEMSWREPRDLMGFPIVDKKSDEHAQRAFERIAKEQGVTGATPFFDEFVMADPKKIKALNAIKLERKKEGSNE